MRRFNSYLTVGIMALFLLHLIWGALILFGFTPGGSRVFSFFSWALLVFVLLHVFIGIVLTVDTLRAQKKSGASYPGLNRLFWIRRFSGFAMLILAVVHIVIFTGRQTDGGYRLNYFGAGALITQLLLVLSLIIHIGVNIKPLKIALGAEDRKNLKADILVVITVLLFISAAAFLVYYIRWQRV